jgi:SIR2-like domain
MEIPPVLEGAIREGRAVLVLGAGASLGAKDASGKSAPSSRELGDRLADRFLGGKYKDLPLSQIAEYAISEADLVTVQEFIRELFEHLEPSDAHRLIPKFVWWGLATTNYDRLVERAYEVTSTVLQIPRPFIANGDRVEDHIRDPRSIMVLKLHGCVTRTGNPACPLTRGSVPIFPGRAPLPPQPRGSQSHSNRRARRLLGQSERRSPPFHEVVVPCRAGISLD